MDVCANLCSYVMWAAQYFTFEVSCPLVSHKRFIAVSTMFLLSQFPRLLATASIKVLRLVVVRCGAARMRMRWFLFLEYMFWKIAFLK